MLVVMHVQRSYCSSKYSCTSGGWGHVPLPLHCFARAGRRGAQVDDCFEVFCTVVYWSGPCEFCLSPFPSLTLHPSHYSHSPFTHTLHSSHSPSLLTLTLHSSHSHSLLSPPMHLSPLPFHLPHIPPLPSSPGTQPYLDFTLSLPPSLPPSLSPGNSVL